MAQNKNNTKVINKVARFFSSTVKYKYECKYINGRKKK